MISGEGEGSVTLGTMYGALCGSGEMSMASMPGEDDGIAGVVTLPTSMGGVRSRSFPGQ